MSRGEAPNYKCTVCGQYFLHPPEKHMHMVPTAWKEIECTGEIRKVVYDRVPEPTGVDCCKQCQAMASNGSGCDHFEDLVYCNNHDCECHRIK